MVKALFLFRNEKHHDMKRKRREVMVPGERIRVGDRNITKSLNHVKLTGESKHILTIEIELAVAFSMLILHFMKNEIPIYREPCYLFGIVLGRHFLFHTY